MSTKGRRLAHLEAVLGDVLFHAALAKARQAGPEHFAETLLANVPPGLTTEWVWFDLDAMTGEEWGLLLSPEVRGAIDNLPPDALRRVARGEVEVRP